MKKFKRIQRILITVLIMLGIVTLIGTSEVYGAYLKATSKRPYSDDNGDNTVGNDVYKLRVTPNQNIFKIYDRDKAITGANSYPDAIYCLRGQLGFGETSTNPESNAGLLYNIVGDMRTDKATVMSRYQTVTGKTISNNDYNSILWIIDQMYLPRHVNTEDNTKTVTERKDMRDRLLMSAFTRHYKAKYPSDTAAETEARAKASVGFSTLTDDDIEVIQQVAIWYFSNADTRGQAGSVALAKNDAVAILQSYLEVNDNIISDLDRSEDIDILYQYLRDGAAENAGTTVAPPVIELENTAPKTKEITKTQGISQLQYYVVGPFEITKTGGDDYDLLGKIHYTRAIGNPIEIDLDDGALEIQSAYVSDENGTAIGKIEDMVGEGEFYVTVNKDLYGTAEKIELEIEYSYWDIKKADFMDAGNGQQPVVLVEKVKKYENDTITTEFVDGKFNLELNKIDEDGQLIISDEATFTIRRIPKSAETYYTTSDNKQNGTVTGKIQIKDIPIVEDDEQFIYEIEETKAPIGYEGKTGKFYVRVVTEKVGEEYKVKSADLIESSSSNVAITVEGVTLTLSDDKTTIQISVVNKEKEEFDLSLRKFITQINDKELTGDDSREPELDLSKLRANSESTAKYIHPKNPLSVQQGDIVTYKLRLYNEADIDGYASEITDYLPEGLGFITSYKTNYENGWSIPNPLPSGSKIVNLVGEDGLYESSDKVKNIKLEDLEGVTSLDEVTIIAGKVPVTTSVLERDAIDPEATVIKAYDRETNSEGVGDRDLWQQTGEERTNRWTIL